MPGPRRAGFPRLEGTSPEGVEPGAPQVLRGALLLAHSSPCAPGGQIFATLLHRPPYSAAAVAVALDGEKQLLMDPTLQEEKVRQPAGNMLSGGSRLGAAGLSMRGQPPLRLAGLHRQPTPFLCAGGCCGGVLCLPLCLCGGHRPSKQRQRPAGGTDGAHPWPDELG